MTTTIFKGDSPAIGNPGELARMFQSGEKPRAAWRIGTEHEKIGFRNATGKPLPYEGPGGIQEILEQFRQRFGWKAVLEGGNVVALQRGQGSITLEPGGQFELSGAILESAHQTCVELAQHQKEMREISLDMGITWLMAGRNPLIPTAEMPWMPKRRYALMRRYLPTRGKMALDMMLGTATAQTNIDYANEADMSRKLRASISVSPFITALFANSPFANGRPTGWLSERMHIWEHTDPDRSGFIPRVFAGDFGYADYVNYALNVPMFFIYREGEYRDYGGRSFREFLERGLDGNIATEEDWELHLTTLFPLVRVKKYLELRMADVGPLSMVCALAALTRGLFYDDTALGEVLALTSKLRPESYPLMQREAARVALRAEIGGRPGREWCRDLLAIARAGLKRLNVLNAHGQNETKYLDPLDEIVESGTTLAERLLAEYEGPWGRRMEKILNHEPLQFCPDVPMLESAGCESPE